jgi:phosphoribosylanthranilate isomerase
MTKVKICGIKRLGDAKTAVDAGADALGFVFAKSSRQVTVEQARSIIARLPEEVLKIGVFVNSSKQELEETVEVVGLDFVQLHGEESADFCESLQVPYIKALRVRDETDLRKVENFKGKYFLLDSGFGKYHGGNGTSFEWKLTKSIQDKRQSLILAGGLREENVEEAINITSPYMVDVSSGVETDGEKDPDKIKRFIAKVKAVKKGNVEEEII